MSAQEKNISLLHDDITDILRTLVKSGDSSFERDWEERDVFTWLLVILSWCRGLSEGKHMSFVQHYIAVTRSGVTFLLRMEDIHSLRESNNRQLTKMKFEEILEHREE